MDILMLMVRMLLLRVCMNTRSIRRVIDVSVSMFVCLFVDTKMNN